MFTNNPDGKLIKTGNNLVNIAVRLKNEGNFEVQAETLKLTGGGSLSSNFHDTEIKLSGGGILEISETDSFFLGQEGSVFGDPMMKTIFSGNPGDGTFVIDSNFVARERQSFIFNSDVIWKSGAIGTNSFGDNSKTWEIGSKTGIGKFVISGEGVRRMGGLNLVILRKNSQVIQNGDYFINNLFGIVVEGNYILNTGNITTNRGGQDGTPFKIGPTGTMTVTKNSNHTIEPKTSMIVGSSPKFILESEASVSIHFREPTLENPDIEETENRRDTALYYEGQLLAGNWILEENSHITASDGVEIDTLWSGVTVNLSKDASFNNLPNVLGDFTVKYGATLNLHKSTFYVSGDFYLNGRLDGNEGTLTVDGILYNGIGDALNLAIFAGNLTVSATGGVFNFDVAKPGNSAGTITINGDYTQTETGVLEIELGGTGNAGTDYDQLLVNGTATLGGTLIIKEIDGFEWSDAVPIPAIQATIFTGAFNQVVFSTNTSRRIASPTILEDMLSVTASTITPATFGDWRNAHFSEADQANEEVSGLQADPDEDRAANLLEYAFDGIPNYRDAQSVLSEISPNEAGDKYRVKVKFPWAKGMTDVEYTLQTSPDLETWNDLESTLTNTELGEFADLLTVEAEMDAVGNVPSFVRLLVQEKEL
jgi:hypothetical protein